MFSTSLRKATYTIFCLAILSLSSSAFASSGITYQGRILKPDGSPLTGANVQFKLQLRTPDANNCLMYEEVQALDMRNSNGVFALTMNDGTGSRTDASGYSLDKIFSNATGPANAFTFNPATCTTGNSYTANSGDGRSFVVYFKDETMAAYEPMPAQKINFVPLAFEAKQIAGFTPASLVRVAESDGTLDTVSPLSNANYTELLNLIGGTSSQYAKQSAAAGTVVSTVGGTGNVATPSAGSVWLDTTAGNLKFYDGATVKTVGTAGGSVTNIATGTGLTGGPITTTGTISLATLGTGGTGFKVTYDTYGRVTGAVALVEADIPTLTTAGHVSGSAITSGTIAGNTAINTTGAISSGAITSSGLITSPSLSSTAIGTQSVQIFETTNSFKVSITAPASLGANYALTLPTTAGASNQVLTTNGSGVLTWTTPAGTGISALTSDVSASGSGSVAATVNSVGGVTAANVASGANLANAGTNLNTASTLVKRDASGNFAASAITHTSSIFKDTGANTVTVQAPTTVTTSYVLKLPPAVAASAGQYLSSDTSGNLSWSTLPASMAPSGAAGGDLGGTYPNPTVATVGTSTAANIHSAELAANAATAVNTASKIVTRDGSGNFASNVITGNGFTLNNAGSLLNIVSPVGGAWTMTMPATAGSSGQTMITNGSGVMSWTTPLTSSTGFVNGGNAFGANSVVGNTDNFDLTVKTNNLARVTVKNSGAVGIGLTGPATMLDVAGTVRVGDGGETCAAGVAGGVRYNTGNIQFCNGTSWTTLGVAGSGITALTGDVTASGTGSVASTVAQVGGVTAANVASGANLANAATNLNTASTIVKRDASGNFTAGTITSTAMTSGAVTETSTIFKDTGANAVTLSAPTTVSTSYSLKLPAAIAASAGQVLASDTSGNMSWSSLPTALPPNGSAGGDLSGTYPNPTVATVGTSTAANVHAAELAANAATAVNANSKIVARDGSGNFAANVATVNGVALNNAGSILNITNPVGGAWNMTLPATAGSNGQVMQTNGSGVMSWTTPLSSSTGFVNGGNSFGANASVGTNDAFRLDVKTNNLARMTVDSSGNVGIGTTAPTAVLHVQTTSSASSLTGINNYQTYSPAAPGGSGTGIDSEIVSSGSQPINNLNNYFNVANGSSGAATNVAGILDYAGIGGGGGNVTNLTGLAVRNYNYGASATVTNNYTIKVDPPYGSNVAGIQNNYGVYIGDHSNTGSISNFNLYSAGTNSKNYFAGNVGIGTTAPAAKLQIVGSLTTSGGDFNLNDAGVIDTSAVRVFSAGGGLYLQNGNGNLTQFRSKSATPIMTIADYGSVGIGTTAPATKLEVAGTLKVGDGGETCGATYAGGVRYNGGNIQFCNGTSWSTLGVAGSGITALTGDVTASGTGSVAATVANVGGVTAANVATGANLANAATNSNTASTIVKRDGSGNFAASAVTSTSNILKDTGSNTVTVQAPTTVSTSYVLKLPTAVAASAGQVLASDTSGNMSWSSLPTALPPNGSAGGDLSGTYPNPTVATVGTSTAANVHSAELAANAATNLNSVSTIVKRDGSGNFAANVATVNGVALNNAGSILNITNPVGGAWNMTLPATAGSNGQVMQTNGSGLMTWTTPLTSSTGFINGGNSFGANASIGTNDAFRLDVKTNNAVAMTVDSTGKVGIGTTAPSYPLTVVGGMYSSGNLTVNGYEQQYTWNNTPYTSTSSSSNTPANVAVSINNSDTTAGDAISLAFTNKNGAANAYISAVSGAGATSALAFGQQTGATAYAERMRIDTSGNVGIGTTAPGSTLDVNGNVQFEGNIKATASGYGIAVGNAASNGAWSGIALGDGANNNQSGGVALGYVATANGAGSRSVAIGAQSLVTGSLSTTIGSSSSNSADNAVSIGHNVRVGSGTVGDGTGNYSVAIGAGNAAGAWPRVTGVGSVGVFLGDQSGVVLSNNNVMSIMGGNVGIGTTSPATKLEVTGTLKVGDGGETCGATYAGGVRYNGGNIQFCNGTSWSTLGVAGAGITALTGDVTATGTGSVAATVAQVGGVTAANVATGANLANAATNLNTASTIVKRDASGNFAASAITETSSVFKDTGANTVTVQAPTTVSTSYALKLPAAVAASAGQVLASDTSGNMSWSSLPTALPPNGAAGGDLSGTYPNPTVATVGTSTAANVHSAELAANAATAVNTNSKIVARDGSGNFAANVATVNGVALNNAGSILNITNPVGGAWNMILPATAGSNGQVMQTNGSGVMSWTTPLTSSTGFINGGNSFGANASIGTNDAYRLDIKTNNAVAATVDSAGKVGVGTTAPQFQMQLRGNTDLVTAVVDIDGVNAAPNFQGRRANGTFASPTPPTPGTPLAIFSGRGFDGTGYSNYADGAMFIYASDTFSTTAKGTFLSFATTPTGATSASERMRLDQNGYLMVGSSGAPDSPIEVSANAAALPAPPSATVAHFGNVDGSNSRVLVDAFGTGKYGSVTLRSARGTAAAPTATQSGDYMGQVSVMGYGATGYPSGSAPFIVAKASENYTDTAQGMDLRLQTVANGTTVAVNRLMIDNAGKVGINQVSPATQLDVAGTLKIGDGGETCGASYAGAVRYNTGTIQFCNGTSWGPLGGGAATSVAASAGTAAAPSISFSGNTNTGLYSNGANVIGVSTGGTNVFNISSSGLVSPTTGGASVTTANGTAAAPTYSFAGDTGTGWWRPAASTMAASTGGSERVRIDNAGNVGIGTTAPTSPLHVFTSAAGSASGQTALTLSGNTGATGYGPALQFTDNYGNPTARIRAAWEAASTVGLSLGGISGDVMRITGTGNVGIGTTAPGAQLHVVNAIRSGVAASASYGTVEIATASASYASLVGQSDGSLNVYAPYGLNLNAGNQINLQNKLLTTFDITMANGGKLTSNAGYPLTFATDNGTARMTVVNSTGNVGIGTTAPSARLNVAGVANSPTAYLYTVGTASQSYGMLMDAGTNASDYAMHLRNASASASLMYVRGDGNVGIGTTAPMEKIDVGGGVRMGTTASMNAGTLRWNGTNFQGTDGVSWYNIMPNPPAAGGCDQTQTFNTPGTYGYTVPASFATITVKVWGAGGAGGYFFGTNSQGGGSSTVSSLGLTGGGGGPGGRDTTGSMTSYGLGGVAAGGSINLSGSNGTKGTYATFSGSGGTAPSGGGAGGAGVGVGGYRNPGGVPGGGGGGGTPEGSTQNAGGGGSGGYTEKTFTPGTLPPGTTINDIVVGAGGVPGYLGHPAEAGYGGNGQVSVVCSTTGTPSTVGWGSCSIAAFTAASGINSQACTGVVAGSPISCSPAAAASTPTVTWSARASANNTVDLSLSGAFGTSTTWKCMFMNP